VIAAPASGHGKTTVATGLIAAFTARGLAVSPHKVGPDYIDPGYHALAAGRPGRNLDPFLVGVDRIGPLFRHGAATPVPADLAVVEGVMGLYDGATGRGELASTAQVAKLLDSPVLLVVDATAQGRSIAALVGGFRDFDPAVQIGGVVLNRVGSDRHDAILRDALASIGVPVLGSLRRDDAVATPSRHLGLVPAAERSADALATVRALAGFVERSIDLDAVLALAASAGPVPLGGSAGPGPAMADRWDPAAESRAGGGPVRGRPRVAVAGGAAFTFSYAETAELLAAAGADVVTIDPLRDRALPDGTSGLVIGGGFPEVYAAELAANTALASQVGTFAGAIAAECAGLLYLSRSLDGHPMCGVVPADAVMTSRLTLGYREAAATGDSVLARAGERFAGHEFHRTAAVADAGAAWLFDGAGDGKPEGYADRRVHASYLHLHWAGSPQVARRFVAACAGESA
jgi:cobyrinic acid a,c-diamide synthase